MRRVILAVLAATLILGCGGGGGGSSSASPPPAPPPADPFGLTQRPNFVGVSLPIDSSQPGSIDLVDAFPNLSFTAAIFLAGVPGENRLVVVEQGGSVYAFDQNASVSTTQVVLDLSGVVLFAGEQGLLGLAFDPDFAQNRSIYVHYSASAPRRSVISRFTWDAATDMASIGSEKIIVELDQPFANHNGGMLAFGPTDGYLYVAFGDGGSGGDPQGNGQNGMTLLGSILRLDVRPANPLDPYDVPLDNPFVGDPGVRDEIFAIGLRNPFRFSFDRQTGDLWLGDVGQGEIEEIDLVTGGGNYGWCAFEGTRDFSGCATGLPSSAFTLPVFEYDHSEGVAVIGGYVYRGTRMVSLLGTYLYTDFGSGTIWSLVYDGANAAVSTVIGTVAGPTSFGEDNGGELFIVTQSGGVFGLQEAGGGAGQVPVLLSDTGIFADLANLIPVSGFIEYDVNVPFWSDGAAKRRWLAVPDASTITFDATDRWTFPEGSVLVKHFEMLMIEGDPASRRRLETRVLVRRGQDWAGFTYRWNTGETDADLVSMRETENLSIALVGGGTADFTYEYPSSADCLVCHNPAAGFALAVKTRQLNRDFDFTATTDNQLRAYNNVNLFTTDIGEVTQYDAFAVPAAARAFLDVNCANCHRPGGPTGVELDLRFETADADMNAINVSPSAGDLGIAGARIVDSGSKETSVLWERMRVLNADRMPPLASHRVDQAGVDLVGAWIDAL